MSHKKEVWTDKDVELLVAIHRNPHCYEPEGKVLSKKLKENLPHHSLASCTSKYYSMKQLAVEPEEKKSVWTEEEWKQFVDGARMIILENNYPVNSPEFLHDIRTFVPRRNVESCKRKLAYLKRRYGDFWPRDLCDPTKNVVFALRDNDHILRKHKWTTDMDDKLLLERKFKKRSWVNIKKEEVFNTHTTESLRKRYSYLLTKENPTKKKAKIDKNS
jgi:hypothetical protein